MIRKKEQRLTLSKYSINDLPVGLKTNSGGVGVIITDRSAEGIASVEYNLYFYNRETKKIETITRDYFIPGGKEKEHIEIVDYADYFFEDNEWKYIFIGSAIKSIEDHNYKVIKSENFKGEQKYIQTKYLEYAHMLEKNRKAELAKELKANKNAPIKVTGSEIEYDSLDNPESHISFKNLSTKTVDAFEVDIYCYDTFDREVTFTGYGNVFGGIAQDIYMPSGSEESLYWTLDLFDNTTKVKVVVTAVHYTDGTTWKKK